MIINLPQPTIPHRISSFAEEKGMVMKSEFHLTLIPYFLKEGLDMKFVEEVKNSMSFNVEFLPSYFLASKYYEVQLPWVPEAHTRTSIIQEVVYPELEAFYKSIHLDYSLEFPHVTLYVGGHQHGIGITTMYDEGLELVAI